MEKKATGHCNGHHAPRFDREYPEHAGAAKQGLIRTILRLYREAEVRDLVACTGVSEEEAERAYDAHGEDYAATRDCLMESALKRFLADG